MATFNKFNSFVEDVAEGVHNLGSDALTIALTAAANAPVATNGQLSDLTAVSTTNLTDITPTISSSSQTSGTYKLVLTDHDLTASGGSCGPFRYVVLYNDTASNDELIGWWDYGSEITLADGETLTLDFDGTEGVIQIA
jgi:hypothetical protein